MTKSGREIMEILEAYDLTGCAHSAAQLAGTDRKTVLRHVALRDAGEDPAVPARRLRAADEFAGKVEELVDRSSGKIRADVVHRRLTAARISRACCFGSGRNQSLWTAERFGVLL